MHFFSYFCAVTKTRKTNILPKMKIKRLYLLGALAPFGRQCFGPNHKYSTTTTAGPFTSPKPELTGHLSDCWRYRGKHTCRQCPENPACRKAFG